MSVCVRCQQSPMVTVCVGVQVCEPCSAQLCAPSLPLLPLLGEVPKQWTCECGVFFYNSEDMCGDCGRIRWEAVGEMKEEEVYQRKIPGNEEGMLPNPYWKCGNCRYEYNMSEVCGKCGGAKQAEVVYSQRPNEYITPAVQQYQGMMSSERQYPESPPGTAVQPPACPYVSYFSTTSKC